MLVFILPSITMASNKVPFLTYKGGGPLLDIKCTDSYCVAVGNTTQGKFQISLSTDKGKTWSVVLKKEEVIKGAPGLVGVDCADSTCITVGVGGVIFRSVDSGKTWTNQLNILGDANSEFSQSIISSVDCVNSKLCYVVGQNSSGGSSKALGPMILKTTDGGINWVRVESSLSGAMAIDLVKMGKILCKNEMECFGIGQQRSIFHTSDGWKNITFQNFKIDDPVPAYNPDGSIVYFIDGKPNSVPEKIARGDFSGISFTNDGGVIVDDMGDRLQIILKSMDNGVTWNTIPFPSLPKLNAGGSISCTGSVCVIASSNGVRGKVNIFTSLDNGNTWTYSSLNKRIMVSGASCIDKNNCFAIGMLIPVGVVIKVK